MRYALVILIWFNLLWLQLGNIAVPLFAYQTFIIPLPPGEPLFAPDTGPCPGNIGWQPPTAGVPEYGLSVCELQ